MEDTIVFQDLVIAAKFNYVLVYKAIDLAKNEKEFSYRRVLDIIKEYTVQ